MKFLRAFLVLAILCTSAGTALSQKINPDDLRNGPKVVQAFKGIVAKPSEATVRVIADGKEVALGTIIDADGYILTKWSEIKGKDKITCKLKDGKVLDAKLVGVKDEGTTAYDLAMLKVEAKGLPTIQWRDGKDLKVGKWVASVGTGENPVAIGVVSVLSRKLKLGDQPPKFNNPTGGYLGVGLEPGMGGAKVNAVSPKSPAEKAGIKVNDLIYEAGGKKIVDHEALINTVGGFKAGDEILLKIKRTEEDLEFKVTLAKRPKELLGNPQETMGTKLSNRRGGFPTILQHDSGVKPEDCGGPLVDLDGKAVGINIARAGRTETYAIPFEDLQPLLPDLKSGKLLPKDLPVAKAKTPAKTPDFVLKTNLGAVDNLDPRRPKSFQKIEEVQLSSGVTYVFEMVSTDPKIDPFLILEDDKGKKVAQDDDGGGYPNAKIVFQAPSDGVYRIIATTFNPGEVGSYTLTVRRQDKK